MRKKHLHSPHARILSTRRQIVHGFGALLGGAVTGCSDTAPPGTSGAGGHGAGMGPGGAGMGPGSAGMGPGGAGTGPGGAGTGPGGAGTGPGGAGTGPGGAGTGPGGAGAGGAGGMGTMRKTASDRVTLGETGIEISRLAMGSGSRGSGGSSDQTRLGSSFTNILTYAYSQGLTLFETADSYGAHRLVAEAIRQVGRQNVTVLTKTTAQTAERVEADLARFREELGVDMIDIVLLHNKQSDTWTTECEGAMDALSRAKQSGAIRAHGVSCHTLAALELAAETDWVDIDLARINPAGIAMDAAPETVIPVLTRMKTAGKGVIGMKILGEGRLANQLDMAISHAVALSCIDAFTIGFTSNTQLDQISQKIATV
jgi:1-deoxyxylulose-5-phosphate synthase